MPSTTGKLLDLAAGEHWLAIGAPDSHLTSPRSYSVRLTRVATAGVYGQAPDLAHWGTIETNGNKGIDGRWTDQHASDTHGYHIRITYTRPSGTTSTVYDQGNTSRFNLVVPDDTTSVDAEVRGWVFGGASGVTLSDGRSVPAGTIWVTQWSSPQTMAWQPGQQPSALGGAREPEPTITAALGVPLQNTLELLDAEDSYGPEWLILIALGAALGAALLVWSVLKRTAMAATAGLILGGLIWMGLGPRLFRSPRRGGLYAGGYPRDLRNARPGEKFPVTTGFLLVLLSVHILSGLVALAFSEDCEGYDCDSVVVGQFAAEVEEQPDGGGGNFIQRGISWIKGGVGVIWENTAGRYQLAWTLLSYDYDWWQASGWAVIDYMVNLFRAILSLTQIVMLIKLVATRRI